MTSTGEVVSVDSGVDCQAVTSGELLTLRKASGDACRIVGAALTLWLLGDFAVHPRWPTPDFLLILATTGFMTFGQALDLLKRLLPFSLPIFAYESFRGFVPRLHGRVNYEWMIDMDKRLVGGDKIPTALLQDALWQGSPRWYDFVYYLTYMSHFALPVLIVILAWKLRPAFYRFAIACYLTVTAGAFVTFIFFPAAPPWLAAREGYIAPIVRVSNHVYAEMNLAHVTTLWSQVSPNPVAAVPSLHAGYATLFAFLIWRMFGARWLLPALAYPLIIFTGTVYAGEHYVIDELLGMLYAFAAIGVVTLVRRWIRRNARGRESLDEHDVFELESVGSAPMR